MMWAELFLVFGSVGFGILVCWLYVIWRYREGIDVQRHREETRRAYFERLR